MSVTIGSTGVYVPFFVDCDSGEMVHAGDHAYMGPPNPHASEDFEEAASPLVDLAYMQRAKTWLMYERDDCNGNFHIDRLMRALMKVLEGERDVDPKVALGGCSFSSILEELRAVQKKPGVFARLAAWAKGVVGRWL